jgi:hypothetical protein
MTVSVFSFAQKIHLGLLINGKTDAETIAAYKFLESSPQYIAKKVYLSEISSADSLAKFDVFGIIILTQPKYESILLQRLNYLTNI